MKKLLADFLGIEEKNVIYYEFDGEQSLTIENEWDFDKECQYIEGNLSEPHYTVNTQLPARRHWVSLEELLVFIYNK